MNFFGGTFFCFLNHRQAYLPEENVKAHVWEDEEVKSLCNTSTHTYISNLKKKIKALHWKGTEHILKKKKKVFKRKKERKKERKKDRKKQNKKHYTAKG